MGAAAAATSFHPVPRVHLCRHRDVLHHLVYLHHHAMTSEGSSCHHRTETKSRPWEAGTNHRHHLLLRQKTRVPGREAYMTLRDHRQTSFLHRHGHCIAAGFVGRVGAALGRGAGGCAPCISVRASAQWMPVLWDKYTRRAACQVGCRVEAIGGCGRVGRGKLRRWSWRSCPEKKAAVSPSRLPYDMSRQSLKWVSADSAARALDHLQGSSSRAHRELLHVYPFLESKVKGKWIHSILPDFKCLLLGHRQVNGISRLITGARQAHMVR